MLLIEPPPGLLDIVQPKRKERVTIRALIPARAQSLLDELAAEPESGGEAEGGARGRTERETPISHRDAARDECGEKTKESLYLWDRLHFRPCGNNTACV